MSGIIFRGNYGRTVYDSRKNETIEKYRTEPEFYQQMVKEGEKRLAELTDEEGAFLRGLEIALKSSRFY